MKRLLLILTIASVTLCQTVHAQYYSVNRLAECDRGDGQDKE